METLETCGNREMGNTKPSPKRCVPSKFWCFTLNNYKIEDLETLETSFHTFCHFWVFGKEKAPTTGMIHLQGYCEFKVKTRPLEVTSLKQLKIHWEKRKGTRYQAYIYCTKENDYKIGGIPPEPDVGEEALECIKTEQLFKWQRDIVELIKEKPDPRKIYWYVDRVGNTGKSELVRYLCINHNAILLGGKTNDMKYGVMKYIEKNKRNPKIILIDLPRTYDNDYLSYAGIEEVKNGMFFNTKYESEMVIFNRPHIVIFSNEEPKKENLTRDRWMVSEINLDDDII